ERRRTTNENRVRVADFSSESVEMARAIIDSSYPRALAANENVEERSRPRRLGRQDLAIDLDLKRPLRGPTRSDGKKIDRARTTPFPRVKSNRLGVDFSLYFGATRRPTALSARRDGLAGKESHPSALGRVFDWLPGRLAQCRAPPAIAVAC